MAATYNYQVHSINGKRLYVRSLEADIDEVTVRWIGNQDLDGVGYYGVNGVFFQMNGSSAGNLYGYAVNNGSYVGGNYQKGGWNSNSTGGFMVRLKNDLPDGTFLFVDTNANQPDQSGYDENQFPVYHNGYQVSLSNVKWAVGGNSLHLDQSYTKSDYLNRLSDDGEIVPDGLNNRPRTAIGYKAGKKIVLATIVDANNIWDESYGCDIWDVRTVMKNVFNCTKGLNLDGGGSTQMSFKHNGVDSYAGYNRAVYSMISVPM